MTDLTFAILKYGFLIGLWIFVWLAVRSINRDVEAISPRRNPRNRNRKRSDRMANMVAVSGVAPVVVPSEESAWSTNASAPPVSPVSSAQSAVNPAILTIIDGPLSGTTVQLSNSSITLGRASSNTLVLNDEFVSSHHARVYQDAATGQWAVEDLDSTNGTKVNDQPIHGACLLPAGVPVRIGATTFELR